MGKRKQVRVKKDSDTVKKQPANRKAMYPAQLFFSFFTAPVK
jgi:hypothetical protein